MSSQRTDSGTRRIVLATFPGAQILDITGPLEVFSTASRLAREARRGRPPAYGVEVVATRAGPVETSSGVEVVARGMASLRGRVDTLIVGGGPGTAEAMRDAAFVEWVRSRSARVRRTAGVCTGALVLAEAGLLHGRRATTHWQACDWLARRYPAIRVETDPIYVRDGDVYTSAGVCAGMDLALALVEEDHGRDLSLAVARQLVLFLRRPGGQSQFSAQLASQLADRAPLRALQTWMADHPGAELSVEALARRVAMSPRNFARVFTREVGVTPARYVEQVRVEAARVRLEESDRGVEGIAVLCGFGTAETMRRAFLRRLRVSPNEYRARFRGGARRSA